MATDESAQAADAGEGDAPEDTAGQPEGGNSRDDGNDEGK